MDQIQQTLFQTTCETVLNSIRDTKGIGTYQEKTIHAILKYYYAPNAAEHEQRVNGFIADIKKENHIMEIQTTGFHTLRNKLAAFLTQYQVTVVYPIVHKKYLRWINPENGEISNGRKSPKTGSSFAIFPELYRIKPFLNHPNLSFCTILMDVEEFRSLDGWSKDKKRGSTRNDRIPLALINELYLHEPKDYRIFIPDDLIEPFTSCDYKQHTPITQTAATLVLNILHYLGLITRVGKDRNFYLYCRSSDFYVL